MRFLSITGEELDELLREYSIVVRRLERCKELVEYMMDKVPNNVREVVEKQYKEVK